MIKSEKKLRELAEILKNGNSLFIIEAIKLLREDEPFEGAIGLLVTYYNNAIDVSGLRIIEEFLNDIKDHSARPEVMAELMKPLKASTICMLVSSCWQSGLDYSDYITYMAKIFLEGDYATAIECMTVIEESVKNSSRKTKDEVIKMVEESDQANTSEKVSLTRELISILKR